MSDIVERLRKINSAKSIAGHASLLEEAADEIERLRRDIERLTAEPPRGTGYPFVFNEKG